MSTVAEGSAILEKTRELCAEIASDPSFIKHQADVERFLNDDAARLQYQSVHERGEELHHKQHAGVELSKTEIAEFEAAREALFKNDIATSFLKAQRELEALQQEIGSYVSTTIELGRVPSEDEMAQAGGGGCCGGGDGGGCGCH